MCRQDRCVQITRILLSDTHAGISARPESQTLRPSAQIPLQKVVKRDVLVLRDPVALVARLHEAKLVTVVGDARLRGLWGVDRCSHGC